MNFHAHGHADLVIGRSVNKLMHASCKEDGVVRSRPNQSGEPGAGIGLKKGYEETP